MKLLTQDDLSQLKARYSNPHFADAVANLKAIATHEMTHPLDIPTEGAGWTHNYTCPTHATRLIFDRDKPHEHVCGIDGESFSGGLYDEAWRGFRNNNLIQSAYAAAVVWAMSDDNTYRQHTIEVLTTYARNYPNYPVHGINAGQGRVMGQSLDEAVWAISATWAFDLIQESLPDDEADYIREHLFRGLGDHLLTQLWTRIHNIQCWHLAGLATIGVLLDDEQYIQPAFDREWGFEAQIEQGVMEDGWWWEGSPHYHFYTLRALTSFGIAIRYRHPDLLDNPRLKRMLTAPLDLLRADFSLPAFNDGWYDNAYTGGTAQYILVYERAYNLWQDPVYLQMMTNIYTHYGTRNNIDALLFGSETLPIAEPMPLKSHVHQFSGYAILNSADQSRQLILKYGPHGGGHGHPDKLALVLWAYGQRLSPDLGTPGYGIPMNNSWYRHTLSHNTILIDEAIQPHQTGERVRFDINDHFTLVEAQVKFSEPDNDTWNDVHLRRVILWKDTYFIDVVIVNCPKAHQIDLAWHHTGALTFEHEIQSAAAFDQTGYAHLKKCRSCDAIQWQAVWSNPNTAMWASNPANTTTYITDAPGNPTSDVMSLILRRVTDKQAVFFSVIEPFEDNSAIHDIQWGQENGVIGVSVEGEHIADTWTIDYENGKYNLV